MTSYMDEHGHMDMWPDDGRISATNNECPDCKGEGAEYEECFICDGRGCWECDNLGYEEQTCKSCGGSGIEQ